MWLEFSLVIFDMCWLHAFAMTRSLSLFLCAVWVWKPATHSSLSSENCSVSTQWLHQTTLRLSVTYSNNFLCKWNSTSRSDTRRSLSPSLLLFVFLPFDLDFPFVLRLQFQKGWRGKRKGGNGLRVELSMWRTWRVFFRGLFSIWTMFGDAEEKVWAFALVAYLLSCLFAISCFSHVHLVGSRKLKSRREQCTYTQTHAHTHSEIWDEI